MGIAIGVTVIVLIAVIWVLQARAAKARAEQKKQPRKKANPYKAVSIVSQKGRCHAVVTIGRKRFLAAEAPPLPLPSCDAAKCECRYRYHEDRRSGIDRRGPAGSIQRDFAGTHIFKDRSRGRRKEDHE